MSSKYVPPSRRAAAPSSDRYITHGSLSFKIPADIANQWHAFERGSVDLTKSRVTQDEVGNWYDLVTTPSIFGYSHVREAIDELGAKNEEWRTRVTLGDTERGAWDHEHQQYETRDEFLKILGWYIRRHQSGRYPYQKPVPEHVHGNFFLYRDPAYNNKENGRDIYHERVSVSEEALQLFRLSILTGAVHVAWLAAGRPIESVEVPWNYIPWADLAPYYFVFRVLQPVGVDLSRLSVINEVQLAPNAKRGIGSGIKGYDKNGRLLPGLKQLDLAQRFTYTQQSLLNHFGTAKLHLASIVLPAHLVSYDIGTARDRIRMAELMELSTRGSSSLISVIPETLKLYEILLLAYSKEQSVKKVDKVIALGLDNLLNEDRVGLPEDHLLWIITREVLYRGRETYNPALVSLLIPEDDFFGLSLDAAYSIGTKALSTLAEVVETVAKPSRRTQSFITTARAEVAKSEREPSALLPALTPASDTDLEIHNEEVSRVLAMGTSRPPTDLEISRRERSTRQAALYEAGAVSRGRNLAKEAEGRRRFTQNMRE